MGSLIESGMIRRNKKLSGRGESEKNDYRYEIKFLSEDSLQDLVSLQNLIAENLPVPEIFRLHDELDFRDIFQSERSLIGVDTEKGLVAYSIIRIPGLAEDNLGRDINLESEEQMKVIHLQATAVHPFFRGNGLQRKLARAHIYEAEKMGYEHIFCTVSPKNPISLHNILSCGFVIRGLIPKYGGWWRYIMHRGTLRTSRISFNANMETNEVNSINSDMNSSDHHGEEIGVRCSDIDGQVNLLKSGFEGFRLALNSKNPEVIFRRF